MYTENPESSGRDSVNESGGFQFNNFCDLCQCNCRSKGVSTSICHSGSQPRSVARHKRKQIRQADC